MALKRYGISMVGAVSVGLLVASLAAAPSAGARAGDLDRSFGLGGRVVTDVGGDGEGSELIALERQADGRLVALGVNVRNLFTPSTVLIRYTADGRLDPTFASGGIAADIEPRSDSHEAQEMPADMLVDRSGAITVVGTKVQDGEPVTALFRYRSDGSRDTAFGTGGEARVSFPEGPSGGEALVGQADGKITVVSRVVIRSSGPRGPQDRPGPLVFALTRFNDDGSLDTGFKSEVTSFGSTANASGSERLGITKGFGPDLSIPAGVVEQADGRLVVAGSYDSEREDRRDGYLARFGRDGRLDQGFGERGRLRVRVGDTVESLVQQTDGRLLVGGRAAFKQLFVARFLPDGSPDLTYGPRGALIAETADRGGPVRAPALAIQGDGAVLVGGSQQERPPYRLSFAIARFSNQRALDASFGPAPGGLVLTRFTSGSQDRATVADLVLQRTPRRLIAAGTLVRNFKSDQFVLAGYHLDPFASVARLSARQSVRGLGARGLKLRTRCTQPCRLTAQLRVKGAGNVAMTGRRLRSGARRISVLKLAPRIAARLQRQAPVRAELVLRFSAHGRSSERITRPLRLAR